MQFRFIARVLSMALREVGDLNVPRHMARAQHVDNSEVVQPRLKLELLQATRVPTGGYFGLKLQLKINSIQIPIKVVDPPF